MSHPSIVTVMATDAKARDKTNSKKAVEETAMTKMLPYNPFHSW
jgi:hypothetical protein